MAKMRGLGRGLDALLGGDEGSASAPGEALATVPIDAIQPGRYQPRTRMDQTALGELADSIRAQGLMQPILVRPIAAGNYEIIAGERRWRAARMAGLSSVPVLVRDVKDNAALAMALIENIQREDLNPIEEAAGIQRLIDEFRMTHEGAAEAVGRSRSAVSNLLRLLSLMPQVRELVERGELDMGHARALLALPATRQAEAARTVAAKRLSVRETEQLVARLSKGGPAQSRRRVDRDIARLEEELSERIGTRVEIKPGTKGTGRIVVRYVNHDHFDELVARLCTRP
ncbi:MAG: ParB/RepB/Spo0J family partition protein [Betaproteobacteria bacterium]|nr:MAG: ParB/RepB/Spo0J family partition protein [Betaproteobacteria bacterium]